MNLTPVERPDNLFMDRTLKTCLRKSLKRPYDFFASLQKSPSRALQGGGGGPGATEDKLGMTLDDVIKVQDPF